MFTELLKNNDFLDFAIALCQLIIILIPIFSKKTLINRQPKSFFKKPAYKRIRPGVYFMIVLTIIGTFMLIKKEANSDVLSKAEIKTASDRYKNILFAVHQNGYVYDAANKKLLDSIHRFYLPLSNAQKVYFDGKPRLSDNANFPKLTDSVVVNKTISMLVTIINVGQSRAENTKISITMFVDSLNTANAVRLDPGTYSIMDAKIGLEYEAHFIIRKILTRNDTIFCTTRYTYTDSLNHPMRPVYGYYMYVKAYGLQFRAIGGNKANQIKFAASKVGYE